MDHTFFVIASYATSAFAIGGLLIWIILSARKAKRDLNAFEQSK